MFCLGGFCPGGFLARGFLSRGFLSGGFCLGGFCPGGFCPRTKRDIDIRELKQTDAAAAILQISIQKDSRPCEFSRPFTSFTLNLNGNLPVDRRRVSLLKLPIEGARLC